MFRQILVDLARMLHVLGLTLGVILAHSDAVKVDMKSSFGRRWDSNTQERAFERQLAERRAFNELQSRLPMAR